MSIFHDCFRFVNNSFSCFGFKMVTQAQAVTVSLNELKNGESDTYYYHYYYYIQSQLMSRAWLINLHDFFFFRVRLV
jgi:hypothetical protein